MNQVKKTTLRLTIVYSLVFFGFTWLFSGGIYLWTNNALGKGYVNHINELVEQTSTKANRELSDDTATIAADIALDRMRNIILVVNALAIILIPTLAYQLSKWSLRPLVKSQLEQQNFISNASHELRTPLAVMSGELELAAKKQRTINEYRQTVTNAAHEVERMTTLVQELLLLARIGSEGKLDTITNVSTDELMEETINLHREMAMGKRVEIKVSLVEAMLKGKRELLVVAFSNLIDNAIKFSSEDSTVKINVTNERGAVIIQIENYGETIPENKRNQIFDRFYQADASRSNQGYGIGLAITKQIIELHKGKIAVTSKSGKTTFTIRF